MKVSELIEKLKEFDPELTVTFSDAEYGTQVVYDLNIVEDAYVTSWHNATVLDLTGEYAEKKHFADKYFIEGKPPVYKPNPIMDNLKVIYDSSVLKDQIILVDRSKLPKSIGDWVDFPIHNNRDKND